MDVAFCAIVPMCEEKRRDEWFRNVSEKCPSPKYLAYYFSREQCLPGSRRTETIFTKP
jgi:hypothetical protein